MRPIPLIISRHASRSEAFLHDYALLRSESFELEVVSKSTDFRKAIREAAERSDIVVVGGGDGSLSLAARLLANSPKTLGVLPLGTTNNFARSLGYTNESPTALLERYSDAAVLPEIRHIDMGSVNHEAFLNVASIGFSGQIAEEVDSHQKKTWGRFAYFFQAIRLLFQAKSFSVNYTLKGEEHTLSAYQILIFNGTHHAGIRIRHHSFLEAGKLYVAFFGGRNPWEYLYQFVRFLLGSPAPQTKRFSFEECTLTIGEEKFLELDGESKSFQTGTFSVKPGILKVIPPSSVKNSL